MADNVAARTRRVEKRGTQSGLQRFMKDVGGIGPHVRPEVIASGTGLRSGEVFGEFLLAVRQVKYVYD